MKTAATICLVLSTFPLTVFANDGGTSNSTTQVIKNVNAPANPQIDYKGFLTLADSLKKVREEHRVPIDVFLKMAKDKKTIILDTRSKSAYDDAHIDGAIHLNFSDFTAKKLAKVIPSKKTRVLIYCNNNFIAPTPRAFESKAIRLALNIPTFVNLHGYGYTNVYELADALKVDDKRIKLVGKAVRLGRISLAFELQYFRSVI